MHYLCREKSYILAKLTNFIGALRWICLFLTYIITDEMNIRKDTDTVSLMRKLIQRLNDASEAYYNGQGERMTDFEWDALFDQLKQLETETGITLPDSPTAKVSEDTIAGQKEAHEFPALSLAKTKQVAELAKWAEGKPIWLSWKLDGLTLVVTYDGGTLTKVVTRGDGHIGTNITQLASALQGIPPTIPYTGHVVIRGEAVISYSDFEIFNMESEEAYANPRNLASGTLTLKDIEEVKRRKVRWIPFSLVYTDEPMTSWGSQMAWLDAMGFKTVEHELIAVPQMATIEHVIGQWTERVTNRTYPYPVDGLVITYDDIAYAQTGSVTGHHATRAGFAFKWQDATAETTLDHVEWSCAASTISPVAVFAPVQLEGTTVKRASLCNISECERLGIGGKGTRITVIKANKIIPKVVGVSQCEGTLEIPATCPVCGAPTHIREREGGGTRTLHCTASSCPAKQLRKFARFVSKAGMDIDGISEQTLAKFINLGWVTTYADLYHLDSHAQELASMDGFGSKSVGNLLRAIEKSRTTEGQRLLYALSIPLCGVDVCKRLLNAYPLEALIQQAATADSVDFFAHIDGIGPEKSAAFVRWVQDASQRDALEKLLQEVTVKPTEQQPKGRLCEGLTFVVTGEVHHYRNRNELKAYIESQGGKVSGSVSGATHFLINNDVASASAKNKKAQALGIPILSEEEFLHRFTNEPADLFAE